MMLGSKVPSPLETVSKPGTQPPSPEFLQLSSGQENIMSNSTPSPTGVNGVTVVSTQKQVNLNPNNFVMYARETDIIDDEVDANDRTEENNGACGGIRPKFITSFDDPLSEDIMSCISALDEVIAEFDDPSLPYIYEDEGLSPQSQPQSTAVLSVNSNPSQSQIVPSSLEETRKYFSREDNEKLVLKNEKANPNHTSQQLVSEKSRSNKTASPSHSHVQSHLIQIPVFSKSSKNSPATNKSSNSGAGPSIQIQPHPNSMEKVTISSAHPSDPSSSSPSTPSSLSSKLPGKPSVLPRTSPNDTGPTNNSKVSKPSGSGVGGTYSKGTNQEILLPRIPSCPPSDKSSVGSCSSSRNSHVHQEPIYSSVGKSRPQLSLGMYTSNSISEGGGHLHHFYPPQEPEIDYNDEHDVVQTQKTSTPVYNINDQNGQELGISRSGSGRMSKASSSGAGGGTGTPATQTTKEMWNFPSEKNLPRSLRKTRKTCFLEDSTATNSEGEKASSLYNESDGEGGHSSIGGHSSASEMEPHPTKVQKQVNGKNSKVDDNRKIYEDIVVRSSKNGGGDGGAIGKANRNSQKQPDISIQEGNNPCSSNSFTFNSFNNSSNSFTGGIGDPTAPMPKPRARQQIPKVDELSPVKYPPPPGKIPKPNPKPGGATNHTNESSSSPFSPVQCENSRLEEDEMTEKVNSPAVKNLNNGSISPTGVNVNGGNGNCTPGGNMMRMMMMMKGSGNGASNSKNNSTGSASSISRSSSSSSGGDGNYYRRDNLSSSSGVVVTTNSSATTASSPTHSVNNNSLPLSNNNNVTIIHAEGGDVKGSKSITTGGGRGRDLGHGQRVHSAGNKSVKISNQGVQLRKPTTTTTVVLNNGVLEVDDGYLSMINRNEAPLLWPEEFIENETFSPDELKRLSVHLPEEDEEDQSSSPDSSDSCSEGKEIELEIVDYDREPSRRQPSGSQSHSQNLARPSQQQVHRKHVVPEAVEYFSDDSLEGDREEELAMNFQKKKKGRVSTSPYLLYPGSGNGNFAPPPGHLSSSHSSPGGGNYYRQQIMVNTAIISPINRGQNQGQHQVSRIPKMIGGVVSGKKSGSNGSSPDVKEKVPKRKPCSFFVSLTDEGTSEVNSLRSQNHPLKSSSLPMGSKLGAGGPLSLSPVKSSSAMRESNKSPAAPPTPNNLVVVETKSVTTTAPTTPNRTGSNNTSPKYQGTSSNTTPNSGSNLPQPQLRHTKSINTGGPRTTSASTFTTNNPNNNANKRKSTSDLVTVVALNNNPNHEQLSTDQTDFTKPPTTSLNQTSVFNRTSTFLIPSPTCSRNGPDELGPSTGVGAVSGTSLKRPRDDETDDDEDDDFSSEFDILGSSDLVETEQDSLQPQSLSLTDVNDFVSEIMDTALRQQIKQTQMALNNYPIPTMENVGAINSPLIENPVQNTPQEESKRKSPVELDQSNKSSPIVPSPSSCDNGDENDLLGEQERIPVTLGDDGEERARVALQIEAVVSSFLSDNQSFLGRGESEEDDLKEASNVHSSGGGDSNEYDDDKASTGVAPTKDDLEVKGSTISVMEETRAGESSSPPSVEVEVEPANIPETMARPVMSSTPISSSKPVTTPSSFRDSSLVGEEKILDQASSSASEDDEEDSEEQPPAFIPTPPPHHLLTPLPPLSEGSGSVMQMSTRASQQNFQPGFINTNGNLHNLHNSNVRDGKAALDILAERINNCKTFNDSSTPDEDQFQVSQFIHDKRNIWAMYDRPFDEDLLTVSHAGGGRGYASRSQENLMDAMTKERFQKSFISRGSTLPLNCRPPTSQRRSSTFRNMFNKFRKNKQPAGPVIKEIPEYRDDEVQSITSRETGPSEPGKKRGFFSRLFRRSRKN